MNCCSNKELVEKLQTFKNGTNHLRRYCKNCNKFFGFIQQELKDDYILHFGKYKGKKLNEVDDSYLEWLLNQDFIKENVKKKIIWLREDQCKTI